VGGRAFSKLLHVESSIRQQSPLKAIYPACSPPPSLSLSLSLALRGGRAVSGFGGSAEEQTARWNSPRLSRNFNSQLPLSARRPAGDLV